MFKILTSLFPKCKGNLLLNRLCAYDKHNYVNYSASPLFTFNKEFHKSSFEFAKHFVENENKYAYSVLKEIDVYRGTLGYTHLMDEYTLSDQEFNDLCCVDWCNESAESIYLGFKKLSFYSSKNPQTISDEKFNGIVKAIVEKCAQLKDEDLIDILACLRKWSPTVSVNSSNFVNLWKAVDDQCVSRISEWDRNKVLYVADYWYLLNLSSFSEYMWRTIIRLTRRAHNLTPAQLVQCMFYVNARRKFPDIVTMYDIEYSLEKCHDQLSIEEIAIIAMGFFKSKKAISNQNLVIGLMREVMNNIDSIHEIALTALLKVIRYSLVPTSGDSLLPFLDKLTNQVDRLSLMACTHVALIGTNIHVFHKDTIDKIVNRFYNEIKSCRLKDLERVSFALSLYNYKHDKVPSIYDLLAEEICNSDRLEEIEKHPKCLPCCLNYLSQNGIYLEQEISKVFTKEFLVNAYGRNKHKIGREILNLDCSVELECPNYTGNRLDTKTRDYLAKIYTDHIWEYEDLLNRKLNSSNKILLEVYLAAIAVLGSEKKVHLGHLVPHRERADIIYGLNEDGTAVDIPLSFRSLKIGMCKKPPDVPNTRWYCIIIGGWNTLVRNTNEPVGSLVSKIRQLHILDYNTILVPWYEWRLLPAEEQQNYLHSKIYGDLEGRAKIVSH
ncbi:hypothetical protein L9F63_018521 [Diploptera punctata]|uniref:RAP domain-containing protein n=1 Tax=Diploptera punctata TaxID=6984 RepID=A0AAD7ZWQ4_DIPPU|nr:hypothetical protein L9F63_018521 [Diploptera punctata]